MKKFIALIGLATMLVAGSVNAQQVSEENPYVMIKEVANKTFERIKNNQSTLEDNPEQLRTIMKRFNGRRLT